ncbi:hypothetical protein RND81_04G064600 [Saponaria officinalis]|uniref:GRF-type domain-containing protein n=1 Tax=Saponaria officinalis TaxID=3572 RepID=A0AAW1LDA1_SAPOF
MQPTMSNVSYESTSKPVVKCRCGIPAALKTSMTEANTGRRFLTCKFYNPKTVMRGCNYFKWVDEPLNETGLLKFEIEVQKRSLERLENKYDEFSLVVARLKENEKKFSGFLKVVFLLFIFLIYKFVM